MKTLWMVNRPTGCPELDIKYVAETKAAAVEWIANHLKNGADDDYDYDSEDRFEIMEIIAGNSRYFELCYTNTGAAKGYDVVLEKFKMADVEFSGNMNLAVGYDFYSNFLDQVWESKGLAEKLGKDYVVDLKHLATTNQKRAFISQYSNTAAQKIREKICSDDAFVGALSVLGFGSADRSKNNKFHKAFWQHMEKNDLADCVKNAVEKSRG